MTAEAMFPTIRRDVMAVCGRLEHARDMVNMQEQPELWNELDSTITRLQGLLVFIGPYEEEISIRPADPIK